MQRESCMLMRKLIDDIQKYVRALQMMKADIQYSIITGQYYHLFIKCKIRSKSLTGIKSGAK